MRVCPRSEDGSRMVVTFLRTVGTRRTRGPYVQRGEQDCPRSRFFLSDPAREFVLKNENTLTVNYRTRDQKMSVVNKLTVND